ncbi:hypothetical protein [Prosthecobacter sp.]|uniref:hypothetical protein n=1 Tax=Prosthecobacter sp. TaxID=1965333 RepID=UPI0037834F43
MSRAKAHSSHHRLRTVLLVLAVLAVLLVGGYHWLVSTAQKTMRQCLSERGLSLTSSSESWSLLGGITLNDAALRSLPSNDPLIEITALHVDILWRDVWQTHKAVTSWHIKDATLTLHDQAGAVKLKHFTTDVSIRDDKIEIAQLGTDNGPVSVAVKGQITTAAASSDSSASKEPFQLNLKPVRAVLDMLNFKPGGGTFAITGSFAVDLRPAPVEWSATLHGSGPKVELQGVPMQQADVDAQLSQSGMQLSSKIAFARGSATVEASRAGWDEQPLLLSGTVTDTAGHKDTFKGQEIGKTGTLTISQLSGNANLVELAHNIPALSATLPKDVKVTSFPDIVAKDFVFHAGKGGSPEWTLGSLQLRSAAALVVTVREHPLVIEHLQGKVSYDHHAWHFEDLKGGMLGGKFALTASYDGKKLSAADVSLQSLRLDNLKPWVGKLSARLEDAELTLTYRGVIGNDPSSSTGSGTLDLVHAPVVHVPLLDQAYQLFPHILHREHPNDTGEVRARFIMSQGVAMVEPMKVLGQSIVVTARGTVNVNKRTVEGHGRANVRGVVGVVLAPVSVVFLEMQVRGPFDDIKVAPLGIVGAAKSVLHNAAKLSSLVLREGVSVPFEALGMFSKESSKASE